MYEDEKKINHIRFRMSDAELKLMNERMHQMGITSRSAYLRKMALNGYCVNFGISEMREVMYLLGRCGNNLNQYAKVANQTGCIYKGDITELKNEFDGIKAAVDTIGKKLVRF